MKILVINPGATSTKIAIYEDTTEIFKSSVDHSAADLAPFHAVIEQLDYRHGLIANTLKEAGYSAKDFAAVCGRGGLLRHVPSGTYQVNDRMIEDIKNPPYGEHASNLGAILAKSFADEAGVNAYIVDPVCVDELTDIARISGFEGMERQSFFHALNHKGMARKAAAGLGKAYEELNLIVVHMGGGVSVAAHEKGRVIDVFNALDGDGAFSPERAGAVPSGALIRMCFSGEYTEKEVYKKIVGGGGFNAYLGTNDMRDVAKMIDEGDTHADEVREAFILQVCKNIGSMSCVLKGKVDAIIVTGGIAYNKAVVDKMEERAGFIAPFTVYPGEDELTALAEGGLRVLRGEEEAKLYK